MCGRYAVESYAEFAARFQARQLDFHLDSVYNVAPSQQQPVIVEDEDGQRVIRPMRWGLIPRWHRGSGPSIEPINARSETVAEKPMFRDLVRTRRCLVPASGFYEWQRLERRKQPHYIRLRDRSLFAFAGLYDELEQDGRAPLSSYVILTTRANAFMQPIHDRMPVILKPEDEALWLSRDVTDVAQLESLFQPLPSSSLITYPVATSVNDVRHDGRDLIAPQVERRRAS